MCLVAAVCLPARYMTTSYGYADTLNSMTSAGNVKLLCSSNAALPRRSNGLSTWLGANSVIGGSRSEPSRPLLISIVLTTHALMGSVIMSADRSACIVTSAKDLLISQSSSPLNHSYPRDLSRWNLFRRNRRRPTPPPPLTTAPLNMKTLTNVACWTFHQNFFEWSDRLYTRLSTTPSIWTVYRLDQIIRRTKTAPATHWSMMTG